MEQKRPLSGIRIALAEKRELDAFASLLEKEGASVVRCPLVAIIDNPDTDHVQRWLETLLAGEITDLVFYTGEGVRRLGDVAEALGRSPEFVASLARVRKYTRGPKPARALHDLGLRPDATATKPTTEGLIEVLEKESMQGRTLGVQLFSPEIPEAMDRYLKGCGAQVKLVVPYLYAPAADEERVVELIRATIEGEIDVLAFTSASQVDRLCDVAESHGLFEALVQSLSRLKTAAVGPIVAQRMTERGIRVDIAPGTSFFLRPLVKAITEAFSPHPSA